MTKYIVTRSTTRIVEADSREQALKNHKNFNVVIDKFVINQENLEYNYIEKKNDKVKMFDLELEN